MKEVPETGSIPVSPITRTAIAPKRKVVLSRITPNINEGKTSANFDYSGPLTEAILLGGIATRFPKEELNWDAEKLTFSNNKEATSYVKREYRKGWEVKGL